VIPPAQAFDPRLTFETFVVGPTNRLAAAAARRAAESPGASYNPLFLYSNSGLGKSHMLSAIAEHATRIQPELRILHRTADEYLTALAEALSRGEAPGSVLPRTEVDLLLLDDVQFLAGQPQAQEMLLRTLDTLTGRGGQIVLASDRPPAEINDLDARLVSRFSGGLIVDMGPPDFETRAAILHRKLTQRGGVLVDGVVEALARFNFRSVREMQGALNRVLAVQELEGRPVAPDELAGLLGDRYGGGGVPGPGGLTVRELSPSPEESAPWHRALQEAAEEAEAEGYGAQRLRALLARGQEPRGWSELVEAFRGDVRRLREIELRLGAAGVVLSPEVQGLLRDPDRLEEGERWLLRGLESVRPFPPIPAGPSLGELAPALPPLAVRAARAMLGPEPPAYTPLYLESPEPARSRQFLEASARSFLESYPGARVALVSVTEFSDAFIAALTSDVVEPWRARWRTLDLLLLDGVEALADSDRGQEELFHLFEALKRKGARILLAGVRSAGELVGIQDRLVTRFEGGLVVSLGGGQEEVRSQLDQRFATELSSDRVVWEWPRIEDRMVGEGR
jgi:chromosomal replication initiator protein